MTTSTLDRLLCAEWLLLLAACPITPPKNPWLCDDEIVDPNASAPLRDDEE